MENAGNEDEGDASRAMWVCDVRSDVQENVRFLLVQTALRYNTTLKSTLWKSGICCYLSIFYGLWHWVWVMCALTHVSGKWMPYIPALSAQQNRTVHTHKTRKCEYVCHKFCDAAASIIFSIILHKVRE